MAFPKPLLTDAADIEASTSDLIDAIDRAVVSRHTNATTRTSAIPSPTAGMVSYRSDANAIEYYNGSAWTLVGNNMAGICALNTSSGTDTTTSATYVNLAGTGSTTSFSFTKISAATRLLFRCSAGFYVTDGGTSIDFAVLVNGTDYFLTRLGDTVSANVNLTASGFVYVSGLAAGAYTIQGRWKRAGGVGTGGRNQNGTYALNCEEVR